MFEFEFDSASISPCGSLSSGSTTSLRSDESSTSRTPLIPKNRHSDESEVEAAFGSLQSAYGFGSVAPGVVTPAPENSAAKKHPSGSSGARTGPPRQEAKNYQAAFADLQSSFGFGGPTLNRDHSAAVVAPKAAKRAVRVPSKKPSTGSPLAGAPHTASAGAATAQPKAIGKNYGARFAELQSSLGFGGSASMTAAGGSAGVPSS